MDHAVTWNDLLIGDAFVLACAAIIWFLVVYFD
jgi:hypothetical protein